MRHCVRGGVPHAVPWRTTGLISLLLAAPAAKLPKLPAAPAAKLPAAPAAGLPAAPPLHGVPGIANVPVHTFLPGWMTHTLGGLFIVSAIAMITLLAVQTTKQEGLSGTLGGRVESSYARLGADEQLKRITGVAAVAFVVIGTILSLTGL